MNTDFIRGILKTLNRLKTLNVDGVPIGNEILNENKIKGEIYFDEKKKEYLYKDI